MDILISIIMGLIQALTEFFPISSSAHLLLVHELFQWKNIDELAFDVCLHAGTTLAILCFFAREWLNILFAFMPNKHNSEKLVYRRLGMAIVISCLPAGLVGILFKDELEKFFRDPLFAGLNLLVFGIILFLADHRCRGQREMKAINWYDALFIGVFQALAPIPGVSRSGITITAGLLRGFHRAEAARYSFLMVCPLIMGATALKTYDVYSDPIKWSSFISSDWPVFLFGTLSSFIFGLLTIKFFLGFLKRFPMDFFILYRCLLGIFVICYFLI